MSTLGKRVMVKAIREFESLHLRHYLRLIFLFFLKREKLSHLFRQKRLRIIQNKRNAPKLATLPNQFRQMFKLDLL